VTERGAETPDPAFRIEETFSIQVGSDLTWEGEVRKLETSIADRSGTVTQIEALDNRLALQSKRVYGQFNMREDGGKLYCIYSDDWNNQEKTYRGIRAEQLIENLTLLAGFYWEASDGVIAILHYESGYFDGWELDLDTRHVLNLDWNTGQAIGTALVEICEQLGIQFTLKQGDPWTLVFTEKGENIDEDILWNGDDAFSGTKGESMGAGVDTGVHVVGDVAICDTKVTLLPAWDDSRPGSIPNTPDPLPEFLTDEEKNGAYSWMLNPLDSRFLYWSCWAFDGVRFMKACDAVGLYSLTATVGEVNTKILGRSEKDIEPKTWRGRPVWKMRAQEYLNTFPYRLYKIPDSDDLPTITDPYTYASMKASLPLLGNLVTLPNTTTRIWGPVTKLGVDGRKNIIHEYEELVGGATVDRELGTFHFSKWMHKYTEEGEGREQILWWHIRDAEPIARIALRGPIFKRTWGTTKRVGKIVMASLRRKYVCNKNANWYVDEKPFVWWGGDSGEAFDDGVGDPDDIGNYTHSITADKVAEVMAFAHLQQQRVIINGQKQYHGFAGHQPNGWIQKVSVQLNASRGLVSTVDFSNEIPPLHQDNIQNMQRRLLDRQKQSELDAIHGNEDAKEAKEVALLLSARPDPEDKKPTGEQEEPPPNVLDELAGSAPPGAVIQIMQSAPPCAFQKGEVICAEVIESLDSDDWFFRAVHRSCVEKDDSRVLGTCVADCVGSEGAHKVWVCLTGAIPTIMEGEISIGGLLGTIPADSSESGYVTVGPGTGAGKSLEAHANEDGPTRGMAIVGGAGGGEGVVYNAFTGLVQRNTDFHFALADMRATTQENPSWTVTHTIHAFEADGTEKEIEGVWPYSVELHVGETVEWNDADTDLPFSALPIGILYRWEVRVGASCTGEDVAVTSLFNSLWNVFQRGCYGRQL
jgi:hypothetical protein